MKDWFPYSLVLIIPILLLLSLCIFPSYWFEDEAVAKGEEAAGEDKEGDKDDDDDTTSSSEPKPLDKKKEE